MHIGNQKGTEKTTRYWDRQREVYCVKILPGEYYYTGDREYIATTLGSCVSACVWDEKHKVGGMNHFMLPITEKEKDSVTWGSVPTDATRYGNYAMEFLINEILKHGGEKKEFKVKLFGGGKIIEGMGNVGQKNIDFVLQYIKTEGLRLISKDLGDIFPRKVLFNPVSGQAWVKKIKDTKSESLLAKERDYRQSIDTEPDSGEIDLF